MGYEPMYAINVRAYVSCELLIALTVVWLLIAFAVVWLLIALDVAWWLIGYLAMCLIMWYVGF